MASPKPGDMITVQPRMSYYTRSAEGKSTYITPEPYTAMVLAVANGHCIVEGSTSQAHMAEWVQDACKAAGVSPEQGVRIAYANEVTYNFQDQRPDLFKLDLPSIAALVKE